MDLQTLEQLLSLDDFQAIYEQANKVCQDVKGNIVDIRAILEFSNYCRCSCSYCGLSCTNKDVNRYRMTPDEIIETAKQAADVGYQTIVLQSGEDLFYTAKMLGDIVKAIKTTGIKVTLSCGERPASEYAYLRECGADRYLIKHETADEALYNKLHPHSSFEKRVECLKTLKSLGYEAGSGFMIGLPTQTTTSIAKDLLLLQKLNCDMAGIGPFIPHPKTPLKDTSHGDPELTRRAVALARLLMPNINLPATTSLGVIDAKQRDAIFSGGANVIMHKVTPDEHKAKYEIYPSTMKKTRIKEDRAMIEKQIRELGRVPR